MRNPIKDTDYLAISARIKAMETTLLTRERMEQVLEAKTDDEALKLLQESGYPQRSPLPGRRASPICRTAPPTPGISMYSG